MIKNGGRCSADPLNRDDTRKTAHESPKLWVSVDPAFTESACLKDSFEVKNYRAIMPENAITYYGGRQIFNEKNVYVFVVSKGDTELADQLHCLLSGWNKFSKEETAMNEHRCGKITPRSGQYSILAGYIPDQQFFCHFHNVKLTTDLYATDIGKNMKNFGDKHGNVLQLCHLMLNNTGAKKDKYNILHFIGSYINKWLLIAAFNKSASMLYQRILYFLPSEAFKKIGNINPLPESDHEDDDQLVPGSDQDQEAKQTNAGVAEINQKNQENWTDSEQPLESSPCPGTSSSMPPVSSTEGTCRLSEMKSTEDIGKTCVSEMETTEDIDKTCEASSIEENHLCYGNVSADNDSESEPERDTYPIQYKRKADYRPAHLEEHYIPFIWEHTAEESPYAHGSSWWIVSDRNKSILSSQKLSYVSSAQSKSQKRRDNATDTSSEDSHTSVNVKLKDSYLI